MDARLLLGVDGGQSATAAVIGDKQGRILGEGEAGPCNHIGARGGKRKFTEALEGSIRRAWREAGLKGEPKFAAACLGFSGGPEDKRELVGRIVRAERLRISTDAEIALTGATGGGPGIVVIAGTGSIAFGRNRRGRQARAGGWGYVFGDEGGAFDLARQALRAALRAEEGWGSPTKLGPLLLRASESRTVNEALHRFYTEEWPRERVAGLAPLVDRAAEGGDAVARKLLEDAADRLAELALAVRRILFRASGRVLVTYTGGVFESVRIRRAFERRIPSEPARFPPVIGALIEARRLLGWKS